MQPVHIPRSQRQRVRKWRRMQDSFNLIMLVLASIASMLLGVLAAYAIFKVGFALMHWHTRQNAPVAAKAQTQVARVS